MRASWERRAERKYLEFSGSNLLGGARKHFHDNSIPAIPHPQPIISSFDVLLRLVGRTVCLERSLFRLNKFRFYSHFSCNQISVKRVPKSETKPLLPESRRVMVPLESGGPALRCVLDKHFRLGLHLLFTYVVSIRPSPDTSSASSKQNPIQNRFFFLGRQAQIGWFEAAQG